MCARALLALAAGLYACGGGDSSSPGLGDDGGAGSDGASEDADAGSGAGDAAGDSKPADAEGGPDAGSDAAKDGGIDGPGDAGGDAGSDAGDAGTQTYTTNFPLTENPISENGHWVGGQSAGGNLWGNVETTPGLAFGVSEPTTYGDPTAVLTGTWGPTQTATATVRIVATPTGSCCHEAEVRLRMTITANTITGYEVYCSVMPDNPYCHIARWNGPNGSWCNIESSASSTYLADGDVLAGTVSGTNPVIITGFKNGAQVSQASDTGGNCSPGGPAGPWTTGAPGIGFYDNVDNNWSAFGFSSFTAKD